MAIMTLLQWGKYMGYSERRTQELMKEGRIEGVIELTKKIKVVDTETVKLLPPANRARRTGGSHYGRSKPIRGEKNFGRADWRTCED